MKRSLRYFVGALVILASCKQNPFPNDGRLVEKAPPKPGPVAPPLVIDVPPASEVVEGTKLEIPVKAYVPAPGTPVLSIQGLPEGALYDSAKGLITWTPPFNAANDPNDPNVFLKTYSIRFQLTSSEDPVSTAQRTSLIVVRDVPRPIKMTVPETLEMLEEGRDYEQKIELTSEDYPEGPFQLQVSNLPVGAHVFRDLTGPNKFVIKFKPSFGEVKVTESGQSFGMFADRTLKVTAVAAGLVSDTADLRWRIKDVREHAVFLAPGTVSQGTTVSFIIVAEDPNGESPPALTYTRPSFGVSELTTVRTNPGNSARGVNPSIVANFKWNRIPPDKIGSTQTISFKACVDQNRWAKNICKEHKIDINLEAETHPEPIINRPDFAVGTVKYVKEQQNLTIPIRIVDGEYSYASKPTVQISPDNDGEVKWVADILTLEGKKPGLKQFSLIAKSAFGVTRTESFLYEVLPWSWSSVLLFGEGPSDPEVKSTMELFESAQIANPVLQIADPRLLVLRKSVYVSTSAFNEPSVVSAMGKLAVQVPDIVVSTPLLEKLEGELKSAIELAEVKFGPRLTDLTGYELKLAADSGLTTPTADIKLLGKLTAESNRPASVSYAGASKACKPLLVLKKASDPDVVVALKCRRKGGGTLVVAGIEFGDIQTTPVDNRLVKKWLIDLVAQ